MQSDFDGEATRSAMMNEGNAGGRGESASHAVYSVRGQLVVRSFSPSSAAGQCVSVGSHLPTEC